MASVTPVVSLPACSTVSVLHINRGQRWTQKPGPFDWKSCSKTDHSTRPFYPPCRGLFLKSLFHSAIPLFFISHRSCGQVETTCRTSKPFTMRLQHMFSSLFQAFWDPILQLQTMYWHNTLDTPYSLSLCTCFPLLELPPFFFPSIPNSASHWDCSNLNYPWCLIVHEDSSFPEHPWHML